MIGIKSALSLVCLLLLATTAPSTTLAAPVIGSESEVILDTQLAKRAFNPRQKWQSDELNCIQILNPAPGATYQPGYFVRLNYGAGQCDATAAGPWTIHLYNNLDIQGEKVSYDYHEVIASGVNEYKTQYLWTIPNKANRNVKNSNEYYVRIETNSAEGIKLVGNAGPFAIHQDSNGGMRTLAKDISHLQELKRREDAPTPSATEPDENFTAKFALPHNKPSPVNEVIFTPPTPSVILAPVITVNQAPVTSVPAAPAADGTAPKDAITVAGAETTTNTNVPIDIGVAIDSNGSKIQLNDPNSKDEVVAVDSKDKNIVDINELLNAPEIASVVAPTAVDPTVAAVAPGGNTETPAITEIPEVHNTAPTDEIHPPVTEIAHTSFIPGKLLVAGAVAGGAIGVGIVGASFFGQVGGVIGAVVGGIIGGVAVLLNFIGVPV
ncbi:hypothetical protein BGZ96_006447 [Linnemannia gamsii]|uniref:Uncharacterized protein n=1 Tax=Linnemannia gamsii TaxID=64522 RepID=A0ABQ7K367_9FUNG|nr:hypothetical protein BGZ96_006447 [Linnemannia gamsii]